MKIVSIVGARPQFVKAAAVSPLLRSRPGIKEILVHTGQHFDDDMSEVFFQELGIPKPDRNLGIGGGTHGQNTGRMIEAIESVLLEEKPDWLVVYGDTDSTLAGAVAAVKLHIPVAHVEAGLRQFDRRMPEEVNRVLTDHASDLLFAPTETAVRNLLHEAIPEARITLVGDVMYDVALRWRACTGGRGQILESLGLSAGGYILATVHRAENADDPDRLATITEALRQLAAEIPVVLPLHPRTRKALTKAGLSPSAEALHVLPPVGYLDMLCLEASAAIIVTDSGGVQKEAYFQRVPCVTLYESTGWVELVETGWNRLLPPSLGVGALVRSVLDAIGTKGQEVELYGGGKAAERVVARLLTGYQPSAPHSEPCAAPTEQEP